MQPPLIGCSSSGWQSASSSWRCNPPPSGPKSRLARRCLLEDFRVSCELDPGTADVSCEVVPCISAVAALQSIEDQPMFGVDDPEPLLPAHHHERAPIELGRVPQARHHRVQLVDTAGAVGKKVEVAVELEEPAEVEPLLDVVLDLRQAGEVGLREQWQALMQSERLQSLAHPVHDVDFVHGKSRHPGALVRMVLDQTLGLQYAQRLADR